MPENGPLFLAQCRGLRHVCNSKLGALWRVALRIAFKMAPAACLACIPQHNRKSTKRYCVWRCSARSAAPSSSRMRHHQGVFLKIVKTTKPSNCCDCVSQQSSPLTRRRVAAAEDIHRRLQQQMQQLSRASSFGFILIILAPYCNANTPSHCCCSFSQLRANIHAHVSSSQCAQKIMDDTSSISTSAACQIYFLSLL